MAGGRLLFNVALFRATYDDMHIIVRETFIPKTFNGGTANISGAEVETAWMPGGGWSLRANLGTIRAEYDELSESVLNNSTPIPSRLPARQDAELELLRQCVQGVGRHTRSGAHSTAQLVVHGITVPRCDQLLAFVAGWLIAW